MIAVVDVTRYIKTALIHCSRTNLQFINNCIWKVENFYCDCDCFCKKKTTFLAQLSCHDEITDTLNI